MLVIIPTYPFLFFLATAFFTRGRPIQVFTETVGEHEAYPPVVPMAGDIGINIPENGGTGKMHDIEWIPEIEFDGSFVLQYLFGKTK